MILLCTHSHTMQGPLRQRSPTPYMRPHCSQPSQGSVWHLGRRHGYSSLRRELTQSYHHPTCWTKGIPRLVTVSNKTKKVLGKCLVMLYSHSIPGGFIVEGSTLGQHLGKHSLSQKS